MSMLGIDTIKYRVEYRLTIRYGQLSHAWFVESARGAVHLHISDNGEGCTYGRYHGGLEIHYRTPPRYMCDQAPSQCNCWILHAPCWHDGSSLLATETWIPRWEMDPHDHVGMFRALIREYEDRFNAEDESE